MAEIENKVFKEAKRKYEEWGNSFEGIHYNLKVIGDVSIEDDRFVFLIIETLLKLPKKVRDKVLDEVYFVVLSDYLGTMEKLMLPMAGEITLIVLNFSLMRKKSKFYIMSTIAHEIAHFILGHYGLNVHCQGEREADNLTEKWGFKKAYTEKDYKKFEKKLLNKSSN